MGKLRDEEEEDNLQDIALKVCRHHRKLDSREMHPKSDPNSTGMVVLHQFFLFRIQKLSNVSKLIVSVAKMLVWTLIWI